MSIDLERSERDYESRLLDRVAKWVSKHPAKAAELRLVTLRKIGMLAPPPADSIRWLALETAFREEVRKLNNWPTCEQWLKEGT